MTKLETQIRSCSDKAFSDHNITEQMRQGVYRSWRCGRSDTGVYAFTITTIPGSLIITGDLGNLIVSRCYDMLPWCRQSINDINYFAEKVGRMFDTQEYSAERFDEWRDDWLDYYEENKVDGYGDDLDIDELRDYPNDELCDKAYWDLSDFTDGSDPPNWKDYKPGFYWLRDAIRWFVMNHDEPEVRQAK